MEWKRQQGPVTLAQALHEDAPGLVPELQTAGLLNDMPLLDVELSEAEGYGLLHTMLREVCDAVPARARSAAPVLSNPLLDAAKKSKRYCTEALKCLIERVHAYEQTSASSGSAPPVKWGWCRELQSFIFVFEAANRIVLERPEYGMATYFFEMEQPLSANEQMKRMIACMSVPGISRLDLIANKEVLKEAVISCGMKETLEGYGWAMDCGLGTLLNFSERVFHDHLMNADDWKDKIARHIAQGAMMGRVERTYKAPIVGGEGRAMEGEEEGRGVGGRGPPPSPALQERATVKLEESPPVAVAVPILVKEEEAQHERMDELL
uniref:Uncharacterized protein n=1 Tax=Tetraselmis chuii TaxID=63592 RepID=A0A7S1T0Z5_9CHLO